MKAFALTDAIRTRKALRFAARLAPLAFEPRMRLARAEKTVRVSFASPIAR